MRKKSPNLELFSD